MAHFKDADNTVTYADFVSGTNFVPEHVKKERKIISRPFQTPKCIPCNNQETYYIDEKPNLWHLFGSLQTMGRRSSSSVKTQPQS